MKIVDKIINYFEVSRVLHYLVAAYILSQFEIFAIDPNKWWYMLVGTGVVLILSIIKELLDKKFDVGDIIFAMFGCFTEMFILIIKMWFFFDVPFGGMN